jgi:hypothetical protein
MKILIRRPWRGAARIAAEKKYLRSKKGTLIPPATRNPKICRPRLRPKRNQLIGEGILGVLRRMPKPA